MGFSRSSVTNDFECESMCKHWGVLGVLGWGWGARKNKYKTASLAHCTVSVMCIWVSKEGWIRVRRALMLSLIWITLYYVKDLISSKSLEVFCTAILSAPKLIIIHPCRLFLSFYKLVSCNLFWGKKNSLFLFLSLLLLDADTRVIMGGYRHLWHRNIWYIWPGRLSCFWTWCSTPIQMRWGERSKNLSVDTDWRNMLCETSLACYWDTIALQAMRCFFADSHLGMSTCMQFHQACGLTDGPN